MFGIFKNKGEDNENPEWLPLLQETESRWFIFLEKLEIKAEELCTEAIPALKEMANDDTDFDKRNFYKVMSGIKGQLRNIRDKAYTAYDEKILNFQNQLKEEVSILSPQHDFISDFRTRCANRWNKDFQNKLSYWEQKIEEAGKEDYEIVYKKILAEYESIKNKFTCKQCGSPITIDKIFFISTYITCSSCNTQNTYEPSSQARSLQHIARDLAKQRTEHLYNAFLAENSLEREYYFKRHTLSLSRINEKDKSALAQKEQQMDELENRRQQVIINAPILYHQYLRAMYDEWNRITPDLKEHNEIMYQNEINRK